VTSGVGRSTPCVPRLNCDLLGQAARDASASRLWLGARLCDARGTGYQWSATTGIHGRGDLLGSPDVREPLSEGVQETSATRAVLGATRAADVTSGGLQPAPGRTDDRVAAPGAGQREYRNVRGAGPSATVRALWRLCLGLCRFGLTGPEPQHQIDSVSGGCRIGCVLRNELPRRLG
jgi:hypothetical protein